MIGERFTAPKAHGGGTFRVVAADGDAWIVDRLDAFESPRRMTSAGIAERFKVKAAVDEPRPADEQQGWEALAAVNAEVAERMARGRFDLSDTSPEQTFARIAERRPDHA